MTDPQLRSQGTQPPPAMGLALPLPSYSQPNPLSAPTGATRPDSALGAPAVRVHPVAEPGGNRNRGRNARRVPALAGRVQAAGLAGGHPSLQSSLSRRMSSEDSGETEQSDPSKWFDRSNENPAEAFGPRGMDVDPPFFQKETDSSNEDISKEISSHYPFNSHVFPPPPLKPTVTTSTSEDYRSVIDDLTIEIKRLKEELRKYKQNVPESLKKDALFEVRVHGLDRTKKRELEHTLRDFATSVGGSPGGSSGRQKMTTSSGRAGKTTASWGTASKITSPAGNSRLPADSAYASMSNTGNSTNPTQNAASSSSVLLPGRLGRARSAEQKVKSYLEGVPEGLHPKHIIMSENEKKKLVVRRLEKIFTGKMGGRQFDDFSRPPPLSNEASQARSSMSLPPNAVPASEATREAKMLTADQCGHRKGHHHQFRDNGSTSASAGDQTESGAVTGGNGSGGSGNGNGSGSGNSGNGTRSGRNSGRWTQSSPPGNAVKHEQRPTRPHDLDPDRVFPPSENMEYFRHLGITPPSNLSETLFSAEDVAPDAAGWVWLNLICNMAHIHMLNVTPSYVRKAVAEKSRRLQISPDGQKIRWRGGTEGTKFSGESSGDNSKGSPLSEEDSSPNSTKQRKKAKTQRGAAAASGPDRSGTRSSGSGNNLRFTPRTHDRSPNSFHYKPLFVHQASSMEQTSDECLSYGSIGRGLDSNGNSHSGFDNSGLAGLPLAPGRQRLGGSITYYNGAPFCTDLSRDPVDTTTSSSQVPSPESSSPLRPGSKRTSSGSILPMRPLSLRLKGGIEGTGPGIGAVRQGNDSLMQVDEEDEEYAGSDSSSGTDDNGDEEEDGNMFPWADDSEDPPRHRVERLEASGLGGVNPEDHFLVMVTTRRPKLAKRSKRRGASRARSTASKRHMSEDATDSIVSRVAQLTTTSPAPPSRVPSRTGNAVEISYLSGKARRLEPSPLPPPAIFIPPFSSDDEDEDDMDVDFSEDQDESSEIVQLADDANDREEELSRLANQHLSDNTSDEAELSSGDEEDEIDAEAGYDASDSSGEPALDLPMMGTRDEQRAGSSAATAGGLESGLSGYDSSEGDDDVEME